MTSVFDSRILNLVIFVPALFALAVMFLPKGENGQIRVLTLVGMLANLATCVWAWVRFIPLDSQEFQLEYRLQWISEIGLSYHVGIDGLSATLVLLTGVLGPLVVLSSWTFVQERVKAFHIAILLLQTAMLGAICAMDTLLFYMFFEAMLIPMYLLIGMWGSEERQMAATKFFLYTLVGSLLMLVALLSVYFLAGQNGQRSFDYAFIYNNLLSANREVAQCMGDTLCDGSRLSALGSALFRFGPLMFLAFALAFAIKVPMFPLHTWLPDAHVQAPVAGSIVLAGVMLKMGTYGFWRFAIPLFPNALRYKTPSFNLLWLPFLHVPELTMQWIFSLLAVIGIVYGALMCLAQRDIKKLIAYSSVSHLGYCMLGIMALTAEGASGSAYQMLNHGVSTGALFLLFGFLYERRHVRLMSDYGGLAKVMPVFTAFFVIVTFSSIAVPGTNGFVGEFLVLLGSFKSNLPLWMSVAASTCVVLGAAYMLWMVQKVFFGALTNKDNASLSDLNMREMIAAVPFLVLIAVMGLRPQPVLDVLSTSTAKFIARAQYATNAKTVDALQEDRQVRVYVRQLPPPVVANALTPTPTTAAPLPNLRANGGLQAVFRPPGALTPTPVSTDSPKEEGTR